MHSVVSLFHKLNFPLSHFKQIFLNAKLIFLPYCDQNMSEQLIFYFYFFKRFLMSYLNYAGNRTVKRFHMKGPPAFVALPIVRHTLYWE